jgi:hypothetical protein
MLSKVQATREKNELDFIEIKDFCALTTSIQKVKENPQNGREIFSNPISDKGLLSRKYTIQFNNIKPNNPMKK